MSNLAQEEADRFFSHREHHTSHPEDRNDPDNNSSHGSSDETRTRNTRSVSDNDDDEDETLHNMSTLTATSTATYHIPYTQFEANTGPKGVIADAQSFNRAKQSTFRRAFANITNTISSKSQPRQQISDRRKTSDQGSNSGSGSELGAEDDDEEFMNQWRANRLAELSTTNTSSATRRYSPSKRTWGRLDDVDANGYLDAIEKVADDVVVVVCIYDPRSRTSAEVEDALGTLAYKHSTTRFVKLHHDIAEMTHVVIPAILAYRQGDVFATLSDCRAEGLEAMLKRQGILR